MISQILILSFPLLLIIAGFRDLVSYTIPNWISLALAGAFLVALPFLGLGLGEIGVHFLVFAVALLVAMGMFALGWLGGGDAKLFAATSLWFGWPGVAPFLIVTALFGGGLTLLLIMVRKHVPARLVGVWPNELFHQDADVPYGVAIALGALTVFPMSEIFLSAMGG